jgi:hypothetical protein
VPCPRTSAMIFVCFAWSCFSPFFIRVPITFEFSMRFSSSITCWIILESEREWSQVSERDLQCRSKRSATDRRRGSGARSHLRHGFLKLWFNNYDSNIHSASFTQRHSYYEQHKDSILSNIRRRRNEGNTNIGDEAVTLETPICTSCPSEARVCFFNNWNASSTPNNIRNLTRKDKKTKNIGRIWKKKIDERIHVWDNRLAIHGARLKKLVQR